MVLNTRGACGGGITPPFILLKLADLFYMHYYFISVFLYFTCSCPYPWNLVATAGYMQYIYIYDSVVHFPSQHISWDLNTIRSYTGECSVLIAKPNFQSLIFVLRLCTYKWRNCSWSNGPYSNLPPSPPIGILRSATSKLLEP